MGRAGPMPLTTAWALQALAGQQPPPSDPHPGLWLPSRAAGGHAGSLGGGAPATPGAGGHSHGPACCWPCLRWGWSCSAPLSLKTEGPGPREGQRTLHTGCTGVTGEGGPGSDWAMGNSRRAWALAGQGTGDSRCRGLGAFGAVSRVLRRGPAGREDHSGGDQWTALLGQNPWGAAAEAGKVVPGISEQGCGTFPASLALRTPSAPRRRAWPTAFLLSLSLGCGCCASSGITSLPPTAQPSTAWSCC